jgi:hypothetical protein
LCTLNSDVNVETFQTHFRIWAALSSGMGSGHSDGVPRANFRLLKNVKEATK